jgi:hypothetical protein
MFANQIDLLRVLWVFDHHLLQPAIVTRLEDVRGLFEVERHDLRAPLGHLRLPSLLGGAPQTQQDETNTQRKQNSEHIHEDSRVKPVA